MTLAQRLAAGDTLLTAWSGHPAAEGVAAIARSPYDAVTLDMQHGAHTEASIHEGIAWVARYDKPAIVRIPVGRNDAASRAADFGAEAIIAPMINSLAEAQAFAAAVKYPPLGERSWGPGRALDVHDAESPGAYLQSANRFVLTFAMIETRAALDALDAILALPGIDGVFVGPSDFSISWSGGAVVDPALPEMQDEVARIAAKAKAAGKHAAIFAVLPEMVAGYRDMGYRLIALGTDDQIVTAGAAALIKAAL